MLAFRAWYYDSTYRYTMTDNLQPIPRASAQARKPEGNPKADKRRYFIVIAFVIAAVLTPPDVLSQSSLAIPLLALYEGSIIAVSIVEKKAAAAAAQGSSSNPSATNPAE